MLSLPLSILYSFLFFFVYYLFLVLSQFADLMLLILNDFIVTMSMCLSFLSSVFHLLSSSSCFFLIYWLLFLHHLFSLPCITPTYSLEVAQLSTIAAGFPISWKLSLFMCHLKVSLMLDVHSFVGCLFVLLEISLVLFNFAYNVKFFVIY